jgi:hypothetical protein
VVDQRVPENSLRRVAFCGRSAASSPARAENPEISSQRAVERTDFSNDEIEAGFFKIAFGAELQLGVAVQIR